jgi:hypothetical protein
VPLIEDVLLTLPEHYRFSVGFLLLDLSILHGVLYVVDFLFRLANMSFFELQMMITPLISSSPSK